MILRFMDKIVMLNIEVNLGFDFLGRVPKFACTNW